MIVELYYKYSNHNSEFVNELIKYINDTMKDIYWIVADLEIVTNDREDYINNKPMFSDRVNKFETKVSREFGVYISTEELSEIIFESRTVRMAALACFKEDTPKLKQYIPLVESDKDKIKSTDAILEVRILDGDIISIIGNNGVDLENIKGKFNNYLA